MVLVGENITKMYDSLKKVSIEHVYHTIRNPKQSLSQKIKQLRVVRSLDINQYNNLKKQLPYFVCGIFNPFFRKTENFLYIEYFVIDIDHISEKQYAIETIKQDLLKDERIVLMFTSPSEDGLKIIFRLKEKCRDAGIYSLFYKLFVEKFSLQYQLFQVIDAKTCDVSRACFLSHDPTAYYNPQAQLVSISDYLDLDNPSQLFNYKKSFLHQEKEQQLQEKLKKQEEMVNKEPSSVAVDKIKELLQLKRAKQKEKITCYVPEELNIIMKSLLAFLSENNIETYEVIDIQYGKKLRMKVGHELAEINVFYGKKGFSVVSSPRSGTSPSLNELIAELIKYFLN